MYAACRGQVDGTPYCPGVLPMYCSEGFDRPAVTAGGELEAKAPSSMGQHFIFRMSPSHSQQFGIWPAFFMLCTHVRFI